MSSRKVGALLAMATSLFLQANVPAFAVGPARTAAAHPISIAAAAAALPEDLPPTRAVLTASTTNRFGFVQPCLLRVRPTAFDAKQVNDTYGSDPLAVTWTISATVFSTSAEAKSAMAGISSVERHCAPRAMVGSIAIARTLSQRYSAGHWTGYRTVDHMTFLSNDGSAVSTRRFTDEYLLRGNVVLSMHEYGPTGPGSEPEQEHWRRTVTRLVLNRFDKASAN
jgi:hypothetical protein